MMQAIPGGAAAQAFGHAPKGPRLRFLTCASPDFILKRLLVGPASTACSSSGATFANEGLSRKHNPEFTMLEPTRPTAINRGP